MKLRFYVNPDSGELEISKHGVTEEEVHEIFDAPDEDVRGRSGTRTVIGRTASGRWLMVVYTRQTNPDSCFVISAYAPTPNAIKALRARLRKK